MSAAAATQPLDLLEQLERKSRARQVNVELLLQADHSLNFRHRQTREPPLGPIAPERLHDSFRDYLDDELLAQAACFAQLAQRKLDGIVEQHASDRIGHDELSMACLG